MKCQILFSGKNKKNNIILLSAENAQRVVKVKALLQLASMKGDCKVQTLALEIITPLNECTGRLSRVSTRQVTKFQADWHSGSGAEVQNRFSRWQPWISKSQ